MLATAGPTQGTAELQLSGLIGTASHPDNLIFSLRRRCNSGLQFGSYYLQYVTVSEPATGWTVRGSIPGGGKTFRTCPERP
jgi:hypothetical protein